VKKNDLTLRQGDAEPLFKMIREPGPGMELSFSNEDLRKLCSTRALLRSRFGELGLVVERRLLTLADAKVLGDVTKRAPDRQRPELVFGRLAASVCAKDAGRIYFRAAQAANDDEVNLEEVTHIEIFSIERRGNR
jgi:hypothetical protein